VQRRTIARSAYVAGERRERSGAILDEEIALRVHVRCVRQREARAFESALASLRATVTSKNAYAPSARIARSRWRIDASAYGGFTSALGRWLVRFAAVTHGCAPPIGPELRESVWTT